MKKTNTACCALAQLNNLDNDTPVEEIMNELLKLKEESAQEFIPGDTSGLGQKAIFVITTPSEESLENKLKVVGFKEIHQFERRNGYPEGLLKMYIINI